MSRDIVVDEERVIEFMGDDCRVYATPEMIWDIEELCRDLIFEHLDDGMDSVGIHVATSHSAATLIGMTASFTATVTQINGPRITMSITGRDELDEICSAEHQRFIVSNEKTAARLAAKREAFQKIG